MKKIIFACKKKKKKIKIETLKHLKKLGKNLIEN